jgi:hypothetical protein
VKSGQFGPFLILMIKIATSGTFFKVQPLKEAAFRFDFDGDPTT